MAVITREVFQKGRLFTMGEEVGIEDRDLLSRVSLKWNLSVPEVTTALVGADHEAQFRNSLSVLEGLDMTDEETEVMEKLKTSPTFHTYSGEREKRFLG